MQTNMASSEVLQVNVKSFNLVRAITDKNLFNKVKLSPTARLVLFNLANMYNLKKQCCFPKIKKLILCTGATEKSVISALNELRMKNLIVSSKDDYKTNYYFTKTFFNFLELIEPENISNKPEYFTAEPVKITATCHGTKERTDIKQNKTFSFNSLLELQKNNTVLYHQEISKLSDTDKEKLLKIRLKRTNLTSFQLERLEQLILLTDSEICIINKKEPYHRAEHITIFYNQRMKKIREFTEKPDIQQNQMPKDEKTEILSMLKVGYKAFSKDRIQLNTFLNRNKSKMNQLNISESDLCL